MKLFTSIIEQLKKLTYLFNIHILPIFTSIFLLYFSYVTFEFLINHKQQFSQFGALLLIFSISIGFYYIIDRIFFKGFNTDEELKKGNIAVSLVVIAYFIFIIGLTAVIFI